ncbi:MAG: short-chain dehydrogenase, partial [Xanthobacteraceae bacterium]
EGNRWLTRSAEQVALAGYRGLVAGKTLVVPGWTNQVVTFLPRLVPRNFLADLMARMQAR